MEVSSELEAVSVALSSVMLYQAAKYSLPTEELSGLIGNLFGTRSDRSNNMLIIFVLAYCAFPEAMGRPS